MDTVWLSRDLLIAIHDRPLAEHGGSSGIRDYSLLDSALARPRQTAAYADPPADLADLAAALAYGLARNHPFVDGNKRTAYVACRTFLRLNHSDLIASQEEKFSKTLAMASGSMSETEFAAWIRMNQPQSGSEKLHEDTAHYQG